MRPTPLKAATVVAALVIGLAAVWPLQFLVLQDTRSGCWLFARRVRPGDTFRLGYTHSVKRKPVWDIYRVDERYRIIERETIFPGTGFGLPCRTEPGETFTLLADGSSRISNMQRLIVPPLLLRVERAYGNVFIFNQNQPLDLSQAVGDGVVDLRIRRLTSIHWAAASIRRRLCLKH